jgi:hypothetical protein
VVPPSSLLDEHPTKTAEIRQVVIHQGAVILIAARSLFGARIVRNARLSQTLAFGGRFVATNASSAAPSLRMTATPRPHSG